MTDQTKLGDIVERLRFRAACADYADEMLDGVAKRRLLSNRQLDIDAADAIDRLRAINAELAEALEWTDRRAGLGPHIHDRIRAAIAKAKP
jgi:hypothetical protein